MPGCKDPLQDATVTTQRLFQPDNAADIAYCNLRDLPQNNKLKVFCESLWRRYEPYRGKRRRSPRPSRIPRALHLLGPTRRSPAAPEGAGPPVRLINIKVHDMVAAS